MEPQSRSFDCAIIGGGLAGLCLAIQLAGKGISVVLFEKNKYPFHKVCGEYISMESWDFLTALGLPLSELGLPLINQLGISSEKGFMLNHTLKMGGFGISRYSLDQYLCKIAISKGVTVLEDCRVSSVKPTDVNSSEISTTNGLYRAEITCGSYGKYTPAFMQTDGNEDKTRSGRNYIGVKYHIKTDLPVNRIELHNFRDGYCGISKVDNDWYCLCYLTTADNLRENGKDVKLMEENVLYKNPLLKSYFANSEFVYPQPLIISNVQFSKKHTDVDGVLLLGDAAGSITPLCGNGMSMAMRASKILAVELIKFFEKKQSEKSVTKNYQALWNNAFNLRIMAGYYLQYLFGKENTTDYALKILDKLPLVTGKLISLTHGNRF